MIVAFLARYLRIAEALAALAIVACIAWGWHSLLEHERDIGRAEVRAEYVKQLAEAKGAARQREAELIAQRDKAIENGQVRDQTIRTLAARAGVSSSSLQDAITAIGERLSSATADALRQTTRTYGQLLAACDGEQRSMAEEADRANSEKRTLIEAWPKNAQKADTH
jgi:aspartokinase